MDTILLHILTWQVRYKYISRHVLHHDMQHEDMQHGHKSNMSMSVVQAKLM
jgi:hypothetical protein